MTLGERMKEHEGVSNIKLVRRTPVIVRIDGRAFHTLTRGLKKPFDLNFIAVMEQTMKELCENVGNCVLGYVQSDEITLVLVDYKDIETQPWFDNRLQKIASVSASIATAAFNKNLWRLTKGELGHIESDEELWLFDSKLFKATFDARVFNVPQYEVTNNLIWRQQDATRNSILSLAQSLYPHKQIEGIKCNELQNKMLIEKDMNWNNLETKLKRGSCCIRDNEGKWFIDYNIPIFTENRDYIEKLIIF